MSDGLDSLRVLLAKIEGKQDVANERLSGIRSDVTDLRLVVAGHAESIEKMRLELSRSSQNAKHIEDLTARINALEIDITSKTAKVDGLASGGKIAWMFIGSFPTAIIAAVATKMFGG